MKKLRHTFKNFKNYLQTLLFFLKKLRLNLYKTHLMKGIRTYLKPKDMTHPYEQLPLI